MIIRSCKRGVFICVCVIHISYTQNKNACNALFINDYSVAQLLGKGEVPSSNLGGSTRFFTKLTGLYQESLISLFFNHVFGQTSSSQTCFSHRKIVDDKYDYADKTNLN